MRNLAGVALLAAISCCAWAQHNLAPPPGRASFSHPHHFGHTGVPFPVAFFVPLDAESPSEPAAARTEPQVLVLQAPATTPEISARPAEPLLIEWRDNRYVQVSGEDSRTQMISGEERPLTRETTSLKPSELPAQTVVLLFRDGHSEEIPGYTIADGFLYASADYYSSRAWVRKIDLSALNLSETMKVNRSRGVPFRVPSAANEVIVGP